MRAGGRGAAGLVALFCLIGAACSSVTRLPVTAGGAAADGAARNGPDSSATGPTAGVDRSATGAPTSAAARARGSAGAAAGVAGRAAPGAGSGPAATKCTKPVKIGASYSSDLAAGLAAVGNPGAASQAARYAETVEQSFRIGADDLNKRGGLAGCPIELEFFDFKALAADGFDGQSQQECTHFAEDAKVAMVFAAALESRVLIDCLHQHGVPVVFNGAEYWPAQDDFAKHRGFLYRPAGLVINRWAPFIDVLASVGYFDPGAKVGIMLSDDGSGHNQHLVNDIWKPKLAARGFPNPVVFTFQPVKGYSDVSRVTTQFASAVLQFKGQNVTHVLTTPDAAHVAIFFTQEAESQGYRPRYALTSESGAGGWSSAPENQRPRAVDLSYSISDILDDGVRDTLPSTTSRAHCEQLYRPRNLLVNYAWCEALEFWRAALAGATTVTPATLLAGVEALGTTLPAIVGHAGTRFGVGRYDGNASVRALLWDEAKNEWSPGPPAVAIP